MATEYDNTNTGTLFKNDTEGKSENFPGYGGSLDVNGEQFWISAWVKDGKKGKFFSLAIKPKDAKAAPKAAPVAAGSETYPDDDIPF